MTQNPALDDRQPSGDKPETPISPDWPEITPDTDPLEEGQKDEFASLFGIAPSGEKAHRADFVIDFHKKQKEHDQILNQLASEIQGYNTKLRKIQKRNQNIANALDDIENLQRGLGSLEQRVTRTERLAENMQHSSLIGAISDTILEYPQTALYPISLVAFMAALFYSNPLLALFGGLLLVITILHYGSKSN